MSNVTLLYDSQGWHECYAGEPAEDPLKYWQGNRTRRTEEPDHVMVDPHENRGATMERTRADGKDKQAEKASRLLKLHDEVLATWHQGSKQHRQHHRLIAQQMLATSLAAKLNRCFASRPKYR